MNSIRKREKGFGIIGIVAIVAVILALAAVTIIVIVASGKKPATTNNGSSGQAQQNTPVTWQQTGTSWQPNGTPPACPNPINLSMPADISKITSVLYPGQTRGGNYKPHGGLRFDGDKNHKPTSDIVVYAPMDGVVVRGSRYLVNGEQQYMFDIMNSCGIMYRLGHLRSLTGKFQDIANNFPPAVEGDSHTSFVQPTVPVTEGEEVADSIGTTQGGVNAFFDFGVYDFRTENAASKDVNYQRQHDDDKELAWHGVCWLDWLKTADSQKLHALPAGDPTSGKQSDYCK